MRKGQQQIRCSSDVSIAGRIGSRPQIQGLHPPKMRGQKGQQPGQAPKMAMSGGDAAVHPPHGGDTGMPLPGKDALRLLLADVAPRLPHDVADLPLLLDEGLLPHLLVVALHPPDDILLLFSVATAPHLCPRRRGGCLALLQNVLLHQPSVVLPDPPSAEVLLLKGDARLHPPHLHPDTGGAPCCLLSGQAGRHDPPLRQPAALLGVRPVLRGDLKASVRLQLTREDSNLLHTAANQSAECPAHLSHATTRDHLRVPSL